MRRAKIKQINKHFDALDNDFEGAVEKIIKHHRDYFRKNQMLRNKLSLLQELVSNLENLKISKMIN